MRVFISHSSKDKPAVEGLALALRARGIDPWLDKWQIGPGDDIVTSINTGLDEASAGIIVFSPHSRESRWVDAEVSYLTYARIQERKPLIPVVIGDDAWVPPLLRPLARRGIDEIEAIAEALKGRSAAQLPSVAPEQGRVERVLIALRQEGTSRSMRVEVRIGEELHGSVSVGALPPPLLHAQYQFLGGFRAGLRRNPVTAERSALDANIVALGRELRSLCLPGETGDAVMNLLDGCPIGTLVEVCVEAEGAALLGLPFEALRLPDDRLLVTHPSAVMLRRPVGVGARATERLAGPLKVLVAIGAPDEGQTASAVLDQERELQNILDAVEQARGHENAEVRILEVGHPAAIGAAIEADAYHVLHLSCHGSPGTLELEDEEGRAVATTADQLIAPLKASGRPLPMILLSACHGAVQHGTTASLAESLLRAGVPAVLAMQTAVSDFYATALAGAFYQHLSRREVLLPSRALAAARKDLERERLAAIQRGDVLGTTQPEYATATLFVAGAEAPLADFGFDKISLRVRPVYEVAGPVPQLRLDDLIGRRQELRDCLRTLRNDAGPYHGVVLTGIGGVGKSAVAGRAMQRLREDGWLIPAHVGRFDLGRIAAAIGVALVGSKRAEARELGEVLVRADLDDRVRLPLIARALAEERLVLVLDDFEQNLVPGGGAFLDPDVAQAFRSLAASARRGRLLITCRYPIDGAETLLARVAVGPLSPAQSRKLLLRLPALRSVDRADLAHVVRLVGGHPRMLEFVDALLRGGQGRLPHVTDKLQRLLAEHNIDPKAASRLDEGLQAALALGARDVFLDELVALARQEGIDAALFQLAVSNLPVTPAGVARMLAGDDGEGDLEAAKRALERLSNLSLMHRFPDGTAWVHRWTAEGLTRIDATHRVRCASAGHYRLWRVEHESHDLEDAIEAVRNFLAGQEFDVAAAAVLECFEALRRFQQAMSIAALASEVLETLPASHRGFAAVADEEAQAHLALGSTDRALSRYAELHVILERLAKAEPDRADYQRDLSVLYNKMADLYRALGLGDQARDVCQKALAIAQRLARAEPDRADYQRDLSVSYTKMADLYRVLGLRDQALDACQKALAIAQRLAQAEPNRAEYQRDLSVAYNKMGALYDALGQEEHARDAYEKDLAIAERLAQAEPDRADYQVDLSISYNKMGDVYRALRQGEQAGDAYEKALTIRARLAQAEPDRADYQRGLSISHERIGDLYRVFGQDEEARGAYEEALAIRQRLAQAEPDRADYQRDLSVAYNKMGDVYGVLGQAEQAHDTFAKALTIRERLAQAEPDRADYQRDLVTGLVRLAIWDGPAGGNHLRRALGILRSLKHEGRLSVADEPMIPEVERLLEARRAQDT